MSDAPTESSGLPSPEGKDDEVAEIGSWTRLRRLLGYSRAYAGRLALALLALFITSALGLAYPYFFGQAIDAAFTDSDAVDLDTTALLLVGIFLAQAVFMFIRHYLMSWVGERVVADLRQQLQGHLMRLPQAYFHRTRTGELLSRLSDDVTRLQDVVGEDISIFLRNILTLVGGITILFVINPMLTGIMLCVVPPLVIASVLWGRVIRRLSKEAQEKLADASAALQEGIGAIETVQTFTREPHETDRYGARIEDTFQLFVRRILARSWFMSTASFLAFSSIAGIFWLGGHQVIEKRMSAGDLSSFFFYTMAVAAAVGALAGLYTSVQQAIGATSRIFEILDEVPEIRDAPDAQDLLEPRGELAFEGITFAYGDRDMAVLTDFDLVVGAGETVALVGSSGSGKTTIGRLMLRFWDPQQGRVTVDGHDVRGLTLSSLRGSMAAVSQDPVLFSGTIEENIRYGRLEATDEEVREAARAANAHRFIEEFPEGYDTKVGERGVKLSGGQRQRISIARAILRDPRILLLDEATSALDSESEALVQEALEKLSRGRTTVVIAHRLSTVRDADRIVVLDHGKIVEQGKHGELVARGGVYAGLVEKQDLNIAATG